MECSISCSLDETFSNVLEWVVREVSGLCSIIHYLDDFLCIGLANSNVCCILLATVQHIAEVFGVPLALDKKEGPSTVLSVLGILIDTEAMECRLPEAKHVDLRAAVRSARQGNKFTMHQLQSLLGKLHF